MDSDLKQEIFDYYMSWISQDWGDDRRANRLTKQYYELSQQGLWDILEEVSGV